MKKRLNFGYALLFIVTLPVWIVLAAIEQFYKAFDSESTCAFPSAVRPSERPERARQDATRASTQRR